MDTHSAKIQEYWLTSGVENLRFVLPFPQRHSVSYRTAEVKLIDEAPSSVSRRGPAARLVERAVLVVQVPFACDSAARLLRLVK